MSAALLDTTLSTSILETIKIVLPYTANDNPMPTAIANHVVRRLSAALKLASLMEQELAIHRADEAGVSIRAFLSQEVQNALDDVTGDNIVKVDFEGGRKK